MPEAASLLGFDIDECLEVAQIAQKSPLVQGIMKSVSAETIR